MLIYRSFLRDGDDDKGAGGTAPSNADIKASPLFQKLTAEVAGYAKEKADRVAADAATKSEAEEKRLKDAGLFDDIIKGKDDAHAAEIAEIKAGNEAKLLNRDIRAELYKATFTNEKFVSGSVADYNAENDGTVAEYVAALVADEANKPLLATANGVVVPLAPGKVKVEGAGATNWEEVKVWEKSKDRTERIKARELISAHKKATGEYPYQLE